LSEIPALLSQSRKEGVPMMKVRKPSIRHGDVADRDAPLGVPDAAADGGLEAALVGGDQELIGADAPRGGSADGDARASSADVAEYAEVGEHVAGVLRAANEAAGKILEEAQNDAERIAEATRSEAFATLSNANREADRLLGEADQHRVEADEAARATRQTADAYGEQQRRKAHAQAARIIAEADQEAARRADETAERYQTLQDHVGRTEQRLEHLVAGLRDLAARLDDVLHPGGVEDERATSPSLVPAATPKARDEPL
jgi:hypothetical protein